MGRRIGAPRKALGKLLVYYEAMYVILVLWTNHRHGEANNAQIIAGGAGIPSIGTINSTNLKIAREFLAEQDLISTRKEKQSVYYQLTENGLLLGAILNDLSDFLVQRLDW